jgi:hypothetical protein
MLIHFSTCKLETTPGVRGINTFQSDLSDDKLSSCVTSRRCIERLRFVHTRLQGGHSRLQVHVRRRIPKRSTLTKLAISRLLEQAAERLRVGLADA